jgi:hypothetical protein
LREFSDEAKLFKYQTFALILEAMWRAFQVRRGSIAFGKPRRGVDTDDKLESILGAGQE